MRRPSHVRLNGAMQPWQVALEGDRAHVPPPSRLIQVRGSRLCRTTRIGSERVAENGKVGAVPLRQTTCLAEGQIEPSGAGSATIVKVAQRHRTDFDARIRGWSRTAGAKVDASSFLESRIECGCHGIPDPDAALVYPHRLPIRIVSHICGNHRVVLHTWVDAPTRLILIVPVSCDVWRGACGVEDVILNRFLPCDAIENPGNDSARG